MHGETGPQHVDARGRGERSRAAGLHAEAERERGERRVQYGPVLLPEPRGSSVALFPEPELFGVFTGTGRAQASIYQKYQ